MHQRASLKAVPDCSDVDEERKCILADIASSTISVITT